ncbi:AraC family transcriptional regulator [Aquiflexum gelatinilyticum]|uniref:AraC family transcriptional regulator n=1 Tax=Aquiflexum gelatinilyticum TaxID=2961943 RepID=A0A9X2P9C5_9BACT|nr:AraC family transcriptional regulator [Aquiflexum gelatinilyticum]MCR9014485.1 AraC family transcriptional regulator [Aquiflexum gelatinilyticum]
MSLKIIPFKIPKSQKEFVRFQVDEGSHFYDKLHQHPEWQLTLILEGKGQLMVGDYLGRFEPGDIYLLGSNVPHVFRSDEEYFQKTNSIKSVSNTIFFDFEALGKGIWEVEEFLELRQWVNNIKGCYVVKCENQEFLKNIIRTFAQKTGMEKVLSALEMIRYLQQPHAMLPLNRLLPIRDYSELEGKRMGNVMAFILAENHRNISLKEVAETANMSKEAFCRFFKERTGKTYTEFLNELRIHKSCHLLQETDLSISQIAYQTGFQNLSYFNRAFKKYILTTPKLFRKQIHFQNL